MSTRKQTVDSRLDALDAAGCERVFVDKVSGKPGRGSAGGTGYGWSSRTQRW